jgi:hypothetical protein
MGVSMVGSHAWWGHLILEAVKSSQVKSSHLILEAVHELASLLGGNAAATVHL